ncbi:MAG: CapA family protein [Candidatus Yonathbacteria bacterium]|nr:CapA family protein [Candidatus Yonathbacteria bacterium]
MDIFFKKTIRSVAFLGIIFSLLVAWFSFGTPTASMPVGGQGATVALSDTNSSKQQQFETSSIGNTSSTSEAAMVFVGDIMLSRGIGKIMMEQNNWLYPFEHVREYLQKADLVFGNLEGPISGRGRDQGSIYSFNADPYAVQGLSDSHFTVLLVANNHIFDYGRDAFLDTLAVLRLSGIDAVGGGVNFEDAHRPLVRNIKGTKVAFLGYTNLLPRSYGEQDSVPATSYLDEEIMKHDIESAKTLADIVVVSFHWDDEYKTKHNDFQERVAHDAIDVGASLVVGHHSHVVEEVEEYHGGYIAYSLGNFIFDQNFSEDTSKGLLLEVKVNNKKISGIKTLGVSFNSSFQPSIMESNF